MEKYILNRDEVCSYLQISVNTMRKLIDTDNDFPKPLSITDSDNSQKKWRVKDLQDYIDKRWVKCNASEDL